MAKGKYQKFWSRPWGSRSWECEINVWMGQAELVQLREFLTAHGQPTSGNTVQLRKRVRDYVAGEVEVRSQRSKDAAARRKQGAEQPDEKEVEIKDNLQVKFGPIEEPGGTDWEVEIAGLIEWADGLEGQVAEQLKDLEGKMNALRDQYDARIQRLQEQLKETFAQNHSLDEQAAEQAMECGKLRKQLEGRPTKEQYEAYGKEIAEEIKKLLDFINQKASIEELSTLVRNRDLVGVLVEAEAKWAKRVREAIEANPDKRTAQKFAAFWGQVVEFMNRPVGGV